MKSHEPKKKIQFNDNVWKIKWIEHLHTYSESPKEQPKKKSFYRFDYRDCERNLIFQ